jgi:hypothetical protein
VLSPLHLTLDMAFADSGGAPSKGPVEYVRDNRTSSFGIAPTSLRVGRSPSRWSKN